MSKEFYRYLIDVEIFQSGPKRWTIRQGNWETIHRAMPLAMLKIYTHKSVPVFRQLLQLLRILSKSRARGVWIKHLRSFSFFSIFTGQKGSYACKVMLGHRHCTDHCVDLNRKFNRVWLKKELWLYLPQKYWPATYKSCCGFCERQDYLTASTPPACTWDKIDMKRLCAVTCASVLSPSINSSTFLSVYHLLPMTSKRSVCIAMCISSSAARYNPPKR